MVYVEVADIKQHYRESSAYPDANIIEMMEEEQAYVENYLKMSPLPPAHPVLRSIIRDLTISRLMLNIASASGEAPGLAVELERQANRKLFQIKSDGLMVEGWTRGNPDKQVINPYPETFWTLEDFS